MKVESNVQVVSDAAALNVSKIWKYFSREKEKCFAWHGSSCGFEIVHQEETKDNYRLYDTSRRIMLTFVFFRLIRIPC